ncbi:MAG: aldo/keto reductase [Chitinophagales bacterium]|jgi:voltage-dependent potassium channel beta subunit|tara:strand:- start:12884 stop:13861 length:978 start_codon:yes stop_codon:yes gene_type:complete
MEYRRMGKSGLQLSALSFGSWVTFGSQIQDNTSEQLMQIAYENGVNFFDNAEAYASGKSEEVMGQILNKMNWDRSTFIVSSKVFWGGDKPNQKGLMRKHVVEACHAALRRLQVDYLDLFYCHRPDIDTPIAETVWTMHNLIQQGKILYWGTSEWNAQQITEAHLVAEKYNLIGPSMEQPQYNLFERSKLEKEYLPLFENYGMGTTVWSPLASGVLTGKYLKGIPKGSRMEIETLSWIKDKVWSPENQEKVQALHNLAGDLGVSLTNMSLAWCLKNPNVSSVILGATKPHQLEENLKSLEVLPKLTTEIMEKIDEVMGNKPSLLRF